VTDLHLEYAGACRTKFRGVPESAGRLLLLGEDNPISMAPEHALYPLPEGCAGNRLCDRILAVSRQTYLAIWRTNLCVEKWSRKAARNRAMNLVVSSAPWRTVILLGSKVTQIFNKAFENELAGGSSSVGRGKIAPFTHARATVDDADFLFVSLPHPSGRNPFWNDPRNAVAARRLLAEIVPEYPWGERLVSGAVPAAPALDLAVLSPDQRERAKRAEEKYQQFAAPVNRPRCYACCQENCGCTPGGCTCDCHGSGAA